MAGNSLPGISASLAESGLRSGESSDTSDRVENVEEIKLEVGGGYNSNQSTFKQHFGLGDCEDKSRVAIKWPNGKTEKYTIKQVNQSVIIHENKKKVD